MEQTTLWVMLKPKELERLFKKHPRLQNFIDAGIITNKRARDILEIDRWLMDEIYNELLQIGAIRATSGNSWRATDELQAYMKEKRER